MKVNGVICKNCKTFVFSRARHDFRSCPCGKISVDGGTSYTRICGDLDNMTDHEIDIDATEQELYDDWNMLRQPDKYGWIKEENLHEYRSVS